MNSLCLCIYVNDKLGHINVHVVSALNEGCTVPCGCTSLVVKAPASDTFKC